jgi:hypothetical protein
MYVDRNRYFITKELFCKKEKGFDENFVSHVMINEIFAYRAVPLFNYS